MTGIRTLRGPLQTADLRGPCIFDLFFLNFEIRILSGPFMRGPYVDNQIIQNAISEVGFGKTVNFLKSTKSEKVLSHYTYNMHD